MDWQDAVQQAGPALHLRIEVTPGVRDTGFPVGYNPWRNRLAVRVRSQAHAGEANADVVRIVALAMGVPETAVRIVAGATDRRKTIVVTGLARADAIARLARLF